MAAQRTKRGTRPADAGVALFFTLFALVLLSGIVATLLLRTMSESKVNASYQDMAQSYYSALAGLEEARGRLVLSVPDAIPVSSLPRNASEVLYIVNSTPDDPVVPDDPLSPYFDREYLREYPAGGEAELLPSGQPNAQTPFAIPYKWVRITVKTEYSSQQDVNLDGVLDPTTPLIFDGSQQQLATEGTLGGLVFKVTALAVQPTGTIRMLQYEVGNPPWLAPPAALAAGGSVTLEGKLKVSGLNTCSGPDVYGIVSGANVTLVRNPKVLGQPAPYLANSSPFPPSPTELLAQLSSFAIPIQEADPENISYDEGSATYFGRWVVLGDLTSFPPSPEAPAIPAIIYSDHSLSIAAGEGAGVLLVEGNLQITGPFRYYGLIAATGSVDIQGHRKNSVEILGALIQAGPFAAGGKGKEPVTVGYDSCALSLGSDILPKTILTFKEIAP